MLTQEDHSNPIQALNVDSLKVDLVVIQNTCSEKEDSNLETASSKSVKKAAWIMQQKMYMQSNTRCQKLRKIACPISDYSSYLQVLSKEDLNGARIEHGFKGAFMSLFGKDDDSFYKYVLLISEVHRFTVFLRLFIPPPKGKKPKAIIKFLGGAFIGAVPEVTYGYLLGVLANEGYLIISVPYNVTFDHSQAAREVFERFHSCLNSLLTYGLPSDALLAAELVDLPLYSVGHSNGALLQVLSGSYFSDKLPKVHDHVIDAPPMGHDNVFGGCDCHRHSLWSVWMHPRFVLYLEYLKLDHCYLLPISLPELFVSSHGGSVWMHPSKAIVAKMGISSSTPGVSPDVAELKDMVRALLLDKKNQSQAPASVKAVEESCVTYGGAHSYRNCPATDGNVYRDNIQEYVSQAAVVNYNQ
ncbi:alpha/beta hydrolase fold protein [Tanacetum coccineum]